MQYPLVSAIVLCYNQAKYVVECLEGVRAQRYPNLELIVSDDASSDNSTEVVAAWLAQSGLRHEFFRHQKNLGLCRSLNVALSRARGKYIAGIAADDVWLPGKLLQQVRIMERSPAKVGVLYGDALQMDEAGRVLPKRFIETYRKFESVPQGNIESALWDGNFIPAMTTLVRRECYEKVGVYDEDLYYEDWDMWLRIARLFDFIYTEEVSAKYRIVATSMQKRRDLMIEAGCHICLKHLKGGDMDREARRAAKCRFQNCAISSYEHRTLRHKYYLLRAFRFSPTPGLALRCLFAVCGVAPDTFARVKGMLQSKRSQPNFLGGDSVASETL
jgi:glycosyltransferase involved in cell wall biosynthesis